MKRPLTIDEVLALQYFGMENSGILKMHLNTFEKLLNENPILEEYLDKANSVLDRQEEAGVISYVWTDAEFPEKLRKIGNDCSPIIHLKGNIGLLNERNAVAVIGARAADKEGNEVAYKLGRKFAEEGHVIVSGLALGCDTSAHKGCLDVGGKTIAIVGNGLDFCHPKENKWLEQRILQDEGLILSEQPFGVKANPSRLVARNRLQAAMSKAVILAQCPEKSGSLHTMRFARKYGKESLAVKFPVVTSTNAGNHTLLTQLSSTSGKPLATPILLNTL